MVAVNVSAILFLICRFLLFFLDSHGHAYPSHRFYGDVHSLSEPVSPSSVTVRNIDIPLLSRHREVDLLAALDMAHGITHSDFWQLFDKCNCGLYFYKSDIHGTHGAVCLNWKQGVAALAESRCRPRPRHLAAPVAPPIPVSSPAPATPTRRTTPISHIPMIQTFPASTLNSPITIRRQDPDVPESISTQLPSHASAASEVHTEYDISGSGSDTGSFDADLQKLVEFFGEGGSDAVPALAVPSQ